MTPSIILSRAREVILKETARINRPAYNSAVKGFIKPGAVFKLGDRPSIILMERSSGSWQAQVIGESAAAAGLCYWNFKSDSPYIFYSSLFIL